MQTLKDNIFEFYAHSEIKPQGWLKNQLLIQAKGLTGNLHKMWRDVKDSKWIGGDCDGWERVPYWLDGFIPLAYLLDDEELKKDAKFYMDNIISRQEEDGWICPCTQSERSNYDMWAFFLICKVLIRYWQLSGDQKAFDATEKALKILYLHIDGNSIFDWAASRWFECLVPIFEVYKEKPQKWLIELCWKLKIQGMDYSCLPDTIWKNQPEKHWTFLTHVVNLGMCLKSEALFSRVDGSDPEAFAKKAIETLFKYHGMAVSHFTGDECLSGTNPFKGSELCSVAEAMYSYEHLVSVTGNTYYADLLERLCFNAYPATVSEDMWTHQYDQQTNQVICKIFTEEKKPFGTNSTESNLFGLEPNFGCCTANMHQAFPKFADSVFMKAKDGVSVISLVPASLTTEIGGVKVKITNISEYPFRYNMKIKIECDSAVNFKLYIRVPGFAENARINGEDAKCGNFFIIEKEWLNEEISVDLGFDFKLHSGERNLISLNRGPLLFSVKIDHKKVMHEYTRNNVERKFPYCDYELFPESEWHYALADEDFCLEYADLGDVPFSESTPAVAVYANMYKCEAKEYEESMGETLWNNDNSKVMKATPVGDKEKVRMIPYGCTYLRLTEYPYIKK